MKLVITIVLLTLLNTAYTYESDWKPNLKFQLENADFMQTMSWVSGVSYTLSKLQTESNYVWGASKSIGSKELINLLNSEHSEQKITSEEAMQTIFSNLKLKYPCESK